jgi:hypothetical protein
MRHFKNFFAAHEQIDEAARRSRSRNQSKWDQGIDRPVAVLTAFEAGSRPLTRLVANRAANEKLVQDFKANGLSFFPVRGMGQEEVKYLWGLITFRTPSEEESFVVQPIDGTMTEQAFISIVQAMLARYNQFAAAVRLPSTPQAFLLEPSGKRSNIGTGVGGRSPKDDYFTQLCGGPRAPDAQLSPYEIRGEGNPINKAINWWRGRTDMNRPADRIKIGQRFSIKDPAQREET